MRKLLVTPSSASYSVELGSEVLTAALAGGPSRTRADFVGAAAQVSVGWVLSPAGFNYLSAFYRSAAARGAEPFQIDLVIDHFELETYTAKFVAGTFRVTGVNGTATAVSASLEVRPQAPDADADEDELVGYETYGEDADLALSYLERLVNITGPAALPG